MTNQASEDIFAGLDKISGYNRLLPTVKGQPEDACNVCGLSPESLKEAIQSLLRTEKLKLLAEVGERVVGEDDRHDNGQVMVNDPSLCMDCTNPDERFSRNTLRAEQRIALTKLEAEL